MFRSLAFIGVLVYVILVLVRNIPGGFVPEEDQGFILVNAQLPGCGVARADRRRHEEGGSGPGEEQSHRRLQHDHAGIRW